MAAWTLASLLMDQWGCSDFNPASCGIFFPGCQALAGEARQGRTTQPRYEQLHQVEWNAASLIRNLVKVHQHGSTARVCPPMEGFFLPGQRDLRPPCPSGAEMLN